jgi:hypothetical protein
MVSAWWLITAFCAGATVSGVWFWLQDYLDHTYLDRPYCVKEGDQRPKQGVDSGIAA